VHLFAGQKPWLRREYPSLQNKLQQRRAAVGPRLKLGQLSKSKLTFPSRSFRRALKGWPDFDLNPFRTEVAPSRSSAFAVRAEILFLDIVFQIVKVQPSCQRLQLNDFFCSTTLAPQRGHGPRSVEGFSAIGRPGPSAGFRTDGRLLLVRPDDVRDFCSLP
jgi:hypothetical protein